MVALIDADSIVYIIAYNYREHPELAKTSVKATCDDFLRMILTMTHADKYIGVFSSKENFRHSVYKYQPYKGNRPVKSDYMILWEPVIKDYFQSKWNFHISNRLEADDIIVALSHIVEEECIICSPDKDLQQVAGKHFDYRKSEFQEISVEQAVLNLWSQVLIGDATDCIAGVPQMGEVKVRKLFDEVAKIEDVNEISLSRVVVDQYRKYFGPYYGPEIFDQTLQTVMMVQPKHRLWGEYSEYIESLKQTGIHEVPETQTDVDSAVLNELGWDIQG
jgi:5'-3' exonuclease